MRHQLGSSIGHTLAWALVPVAGLVLVANLQTAGHVRLPYSSSLTSDQVAEELASSAAGPPPEEDSYASRDIWPPSKWFSKWHKCGVAPLNPLGGGRGRSGLSANESGSSRLIVLGDEQKYGDWPFFVTVRMKDPKGRWGICSGSLISDRHVLTAAHCTYSGKTMMNPSDFELRFGDHRRIGEDEHEMRMGVKSICPSKYYSRCDEDNEAPRHDWAVLEIEKPVEFNDYIQHACLPMNSSELPPTNYDDPKTKCTVVGIGYMGKQSRVVTVDQIDPLPANITPFDTNCKNNQHVVSIDVVRTNVVRTLAIGQVKCPDSVPEDDISRSCWQSKPIGGVCHGDSGGPVLCYRQDGGQWYVMGTVSYGRWDCNTVVDSIDTYADISRLTWDILRDCPNVHMAITNKAADIN